LIMWYWVCMLWPTCITLHLLQLNFN